ncbi:hypothetical protein [Chlorogloea sp. CCALA 695]|uniref:hypothetical protein n=1 Tax=Chlorogloea sp. CCALA 695 TaxID=2107693 RepID=UPI001304B9C0|nr:hypothetical protein [Chlorogloea sp. CCALA 695]
MGLIRKTTGSSSKLTSLRMLKLNKAKYMYLKKRSKGVFAAELGIGNWSITHYPLPIT